MMCSRLLSYVREEGYTFVKPDVDPRDFIKNLCNIANSVQPNVINGELIWADSKESHFVIYSCKQFNIIVDTDIISKREVAEFERAVNKQDNRIRNDEFLQSLKEVNDTYMCPGPFLTDNVFIGAELYDHISQYARHVSTYGWLDINPRLALCISELIGKQYITPGYTDLRCGIEVSNEVSVSPTPQPYATEVNRGGFSKALFNMLTFRI